MMELDADDLVPDSSTESEIMTERDQEGMESDEDEDYKVTREDLIAEYQSMLEEREELQQRRLVNHSLSLSVYLSVSLLICL